MDGGRGGDASAEIRLGNGANKIEDGVMFWKWSGEDHKWSGVIHEEIDGSKYFDDVRRCGVNTGPAGEVVVQKDFWEFVRNELILDIWLSRKEADLQGWRRVAIYK